jgi:hypothetical protein
MKQNKYWNPAKIGPKQEGEVTAYTVAIANLPINPGKEVMEFVRWVETLEGYYGLRPEYPHGTLLIFDTKNHAIAARNQIRNYKGGVQTGNNICECFIPKEYAVTKGQEGSKETT